VIAPATIAVTKERNEGVLGEHARVLVILAGEELFLRGLPALGDDQEEQRLIPEAGLPVALALRRSVPHAKRSTHSG
jgi:hypothetical protein